jgi:hypothetical protein
MSNTPQEAPPSQPTTTAEPKLSNKYDSVRQLSSCSHLMQPSSQNKVEKEARKEKEKQEKVASAIQTKTKAISLSHGLLGES